MKTTSDFSLRIMNDHGTLALDMRKRMERLSSGLRINRGADDPSGQAISSTMKCQIRGYSTCVQNVQDGVSLLQVIDGSMSEMGKTLLRMRDISVRAANEAPLTYSDRDTLNDELQSLARDIDYIAETTTFNNKHVFTGTGELEPDYLGAYTSGNNLYASKADGSYTMKLSDSPAVRNGTPDWSRDGTKIAYASRLAGGDYDIWVMNADKTEATQLTDDPANEIMPRWSPDGSKIVFLRRDGGQYKLWIMNADGTDEKPLGNTAGATYMDIEWSPDGSKIAFLLAQGGSSEIYTIKPDGTGLTNITNDPGTRERRPRWSPDGSRIAYERIDGPNTEIYLMDPDGSNKLNITNTPQDDTYPNWHPDGTKIVFQDEPGGIYVINTDGTNRTLVTDHPAGDIMPILSPDGKSVLFRSYRDNPGRDIYTINLDGTNVTRITYTNGAGINTEFPETWGLPPDPEIKQWLQVRPDNETPHRIEVAFPFVTAKRLGVDALNISSLDGAQVALSSIDTAISRLSTARAEIGSTQNILSAIDRDNNLHHINISAAKSSIEDADVARETTQLTKDRIIEESIINFASDAEDTLRSAALNLIADQEKHS